jgi:PHD/YefM family antitoxin component YafN of YafNO toxin-antitoxin module
MAIQNMTPDAFRERLDELLNEDWFEPIAIMRNGERRVVVLPVEIFDAMFKNTRRSVRVEDLSEAAKKALREAKVAVPSDNSGESGKDEPA